jgi:hypothetical protein
MKNNYVKKNKIMNVEQQKKIDIAINIMQQIKNNNPRIGGSCCLFVLGLKDDFNDVDIIVDTIDGIEFDYPIIPLQHPKRLNRTIKYDIDGIEIDISESLFKENDTFMKYDIQFELPSRVIKARKLIDDYIKENY